MADGMTPAYDAFSQSRDAGTKERVQDRRRVDTYTDPNRYQMPPSRRLYVTADQQNLYEAPSNSMLTSLAEGLAKVKPQIMDYLANKEIEKNKEAVQEGIKEAMASEAARAGDAQFFEDRWKEYGYNKQKSFMLGEDLGTKLETDSANRDLSKSWDEWYNDWYFEQQMANGTPKTNHFMAEFNQGYNKSVIKSKAQDAKRINDIKVEEQKTTTFNHIRRTLDTMYDDDKKITALEWQIIENDAKETSHWDNAQLNEFKFRSIVDLATHNLDLEVLDVLYNPGGIDGKLPPLHSNPAYTEQIDKAHTAIANKIKAAEDAKRAEEKRIKTEVEAIHTKNKKAIKDEIGYQEFMSVSFEASEGEKNLAMKVDYTTYYDDMYTAMLAEYGNDPVKAAEAAKQATLLEARLKGDLNPELVKRRKLRAEQQLNSSTKLNSLLYTSEGGDNTQAWDVIRYAYNQSRKGAFDYKSVIPFWDELTDEHQKYIKDFGKELALLEAKRQRLVKAADPIDPTNDPSSKIKNARSNTSSDPADYNSDAL